jgi:SAM-dependent methyltransferase
MSTSIKYYSSNAEHFANQYDSLSFDAVHSEWYCRIPKRGIALDVGAGSGRDARFLSAQGWSVVAVEPADGLREVAQRYLTKHDKVSPILWINDTLPELAKVFALDTKFDLILLSAVWMHLAPSSRERAFRKLSSLLNANGKLVITLRHGQSPDEREMHSVSTTELAKYAIQFGLSYELLTPAHTEDSETKITDALGRSDVNWQTVLLTLPDDGTGAFPLIRNIVVNDSKASTYKLALLRSVLRIAEGHPGAVLERTDKYVALPLGLVSLYWMKLFKPLLGQSIQQNSNSKKGLGFVKAEGWEKLSSYPNSDFFVGGLYPDVLLSQALYKTLKDIASTIKEMPAKYTTYAQSDQRVFHVESARTSKPKGALLLDHTFLASLGKFYVPVHVWDALTRFSVWIEPALVNEWLSLMTAYQNNQQKGFTKTDYLHALNWDDPKRSTLKVRKRAEELMQKQDVNCCWSGGTIKAQSYDIDHAFPFARWPNNDLWNLLPSRSTVNAKKSDKLPSSIKLNHSRDWILTWWQQAWQHNQQEFFSQANLALPNLSSNNTSFGDVFEAFCFQRDRIKSIQQLQEWG